jgi:hypothetical protein
MAITIQKGQRFVGLNPETGEYFHRRVWRFTVRPEGHYQVVEGPQEGAEVFCEQNAAFLTEQGYELVPVEA